ncbi:hypothetical protein A1Q1_04024 [Trichosporon asahii var. asahii CBS 2479]|uniref:Uncharacterized protein n=1 Tax=Trichosporon asahii var. asahii (strain ATCC 90039 / CBS 2479 / JCM 2466 / KCTC 7840 / NBRC 103889/ NCYC 2677 / UAMH 7654) TaxID=1186058 RepID=J5SRP7_TRIAS|nr:hypothetical protein A1Q1_04024 [Trichosporon asahii var. asahii CBS 2479]EJT47166.1 hypothetical protein A1Q1_04024 [Trichosporon asahii var. asahii CBS 2479]
MNSIALEPGGQLQHPKRQAHPVPALRPSLAQKLQSAHHYRLISSRFEYPSTRVDDTLARQSLTVRVTLMVSFGPKRIIAHPSLDTPESTAAVVSSQLEGTQLTLPGPSPLRRHPPPTWTEDRHGGAGGQLFINGLSKLTSPPSVRCP